MIRDWVLLEHEIRIENTLTDENSEEVQHPKSYQTQRSTLLAIHFTRRPLRVLYRDCIALAARGTETGHYFLRGRRS